MIECYDNDLFEPKIVRYTAKSEDEDIGEKFVNSIKMAIKYMYSKFHYN